MDPTVRDWLLDSDPSIRWQVMRDLLDEPGEVVTAERAKVATEGWGGRLLPFQGRRRAVWAGRPWSHHSTDTFHVLELLRRFGLDPESEPARRAVGLVIEHVTWRDPDFETPWADNPFFDGEVEPCINGNVVATGSYFGVDMAPLVGRLLREQLPDGGWNCEVENGATVSSFGTTINVLEGLLEHERAVGGSVEVRAARQRGEAYMLERRHFRSKVDRRTVIERQLAPVLVPDLVSLRRPARTRLPARRRCGVRRSRRRGSRSRRRSSRFRRPLAAPERPCRRELSRDGRR